MFQPENDSTHAAALYSCCVTEMVGWGWGGCHSSDQICDVSAYLKVMLEQLRLAVCDMGALNFCNDFTFLCTKELST